MKKTISLFLMTLLLSSPLSFVKAEVYKSQKDKMEPKATIATPNDILLDFVKPKVNKIIKKEYGKEMKWSLVKVKDISYIVSNESKRYYKVNTIVTVEDFDKKESKFKFDSITFNVIPQDSNSFTNDLGANISLVEYKHNVNERDTH